jgi:transcriptional regulator with XRE-family HTH domain
VKKLTTKQCDNCGGTGTVPGDGTGEVLRAERERLGLFAKDVADIMGISDSYVYDLEKGNRPLTNDLVARYQTALQELTVNAH